MSVCTESVLTIPLLFTLIKFSIFNTYLPTYLPTYGSTVFFVGPLPLFQFLNLYRVGRILWAGDQPIARPLAIHRTTQTQNTSTQISVPCVGFEPTFPVFERAKTDHELDRAATAIGTISTFLTDLRAIIT
jgi:hypothetical protein